MLGQRIKLLMRGHFVCWLVLMSFFPTAIGQSNSIEYKGFSEEFYQIGDKILAPKIHFSMSGGARVLPQSADSVAVIAAFLAKFPSVGIEIGVHTDSRGHADYNLDLSLFRAKSLRNFLIDQFNILPNRLAVKGYGESAPLVPVHAIEQAETDDLREALHSINNRIELKITKI